MNLVRLKFERNRSSLDLSTRSITGTENRWFLSPKPWFHDMLRWDPSHQSISPGEYKWDFKKRKKKEFLIWRSGGCSEVTGNHSYPLVGIFGRLPMPRMVPQLLLSFENGPFDGRKPIFELQNSSRTWISLWKKF